MKMEHLIAAIIGLFSGAAGSLIAPWVHWGIEKRRDKRAARRNLIVETRKFICSNSFSGFSFSKEHLFLQIKPYLGKKVVEWVEEFEHYFECLDDTPTIHEDLKAALLNELQKIENRWDLI
jgi:hypothetical protein